MGNQCGCGEQTDKQMEDMRTMDNRMDEIGQNMDHDPTSDVAVVIDNLEQYMQDKDIGMN